MKKTLPAFCALLVSLALASPAVAELCKKCKDKAYIQTVGKCAECAGATGSGAFALCKGCSAKLGQCEHCRAKLGALTAPPAERQANSKPKPATQPAVTPLRVETYQQLAIAAEAPDQEDVKAQAQKVEREIREFRDKLKAGLKAEHGTWYQGRQAVMPLIVPHLLASSDAQVLHEALIMARARYGSAEIIPNVIAVLEDLLKKPRDDEAFTRILACEVLGKWPDVRSAPVLLKALEDPFEHHSLAGEPGGGAEHLYRTVWWEADKALRAITRANPIDKPATHRYPKPGQREAHLAAWRKWWQQNQQPAPATVRPGSPQAVRPSSPQSQPATRAVGEAYKFAIAGREYAVKYLDSSATFGQVQDSRKLFVWHKGGGWLIDPLKPDLKTQFKCDWPVGAVSPDLSLAVGTHKQRNVDHWVTYSFAVDLKKNEVIGRMPGLHASQWFFSADGRFIFPLSGYSKAGWSYFDVGQKRVFARKLAELVEFLKDQCDYWSSAVLEDGKTVLLVHRDASGSLRLLLTFQLAKPEDVQPAEGVPAIVQIAGRFGQDLLCVTPDYSKVLLSTKTWKTRPVSKARERMLEGRADPSGEFIYSCHSVSGLLIYERKSGKETAFPSRDGWYFNARSFGATFSADGKLAVVATPYDSQLTFIDTATREIVTRIKTEQPPAGAFLIEPEKPGQAGLCLVVGTFLPYE